VKFHPSSAQPLGSLTAVRKVPPISQYGNVAEIIGQFGGTDQLRNAVNQLQTFLYAS